MGNEIEMACEEVIHTGGDRGRAIVQMVRTREVGVWSTIQNAIYDCGDADPYFADALRDLADAVARAEAEST